MTNALRRFALGVSLAALMASTLAAQEATPFKWDTHTAVPARISDVAVGVNIGLDAVHAFRAEDHAQRWEFVCRTGLAYGIVEGVKAVVHRTRPDGSDRKSFPSGHTSSVVASAGYRPAIGASIAMTVAWGRQAAGKHYGTDVAIGATIGGFSHWLCDRLIPGGD